MHLEPRWQFHRDVSDVRGQEKGCFTPPLDVVVTRPTHHTYCPTKLDVDKDDILYLGFLLWVGHLDVGIRCLGCVQKLDEECVTDGSEALFHDDTDVDKMSVSLRVM